MDWSSKSYKAARGSLPYQPQVSVLFFFPYNPAGLDQPVSKAKRKPSEEAVAERPKFNTKSIQTVLNKGFVFVIDNLLGLVARHLGVSCKRVEDSLDHQRLDGGGVRTKSEMEMDR